MGGLLFLAGVLMLGGVALLRYRVLQRSRAKRESQAGVPVPGLQHEQITHQPQAQPYKPRLDFRKDVDPPDAEAYPREVTSEHLKVWHAPMVRLHGRIMADLRSEFSGRVPGTLYYGHSEKDHGRWRDATWSYAYYLFALVTSELYPGYLNKRSATNDLTSFASFVIDRDNYVYHNGSRIASFSDVDQYPDRIYMATMRSLADAYRAVLKHRQGKPIAGLLRRGSPARHWIGEHWPFAGVECRYPTVERERELIEEVREGVRRNLEDGLRPDESAHRPSMMAKLIESR